MKVSHKRLKAVLASEVRKFGPVSIVLKLGEFPLFDGFFNFLPFNFPDLEDFWDLADSWPFNFPDFLACSILPNPLTSPLPLFLLVAGLLLSFLLEADLLPSFLLEVGLLDDLVIFNIEVSGVAILLKL